MYYYKMGKLKYLSKNIALFSISNFVSKILVFLLVPFYTNVLSTYEYGVADVIQVTLLLLVPMVTVNIGEAALRFGVEEEDNRFYIFKVGIKYVFRADICIALLCSIIYAILNFTQYLKKDELQRYILFFIILFMANALYEFLILYFQGCEAVEIIVIGSIVCTLITIGSNLIYLLVLKAGLNGYLISQILAFSLSSLLMLFIGRRFCISKDDDYNEEQISSMEAKMTAYGKPMIVYSTASWVNNAVDRYFVLYLCGAAVNGVYGVAYKIPAILMVFQRIFAQAWQLSATKSHKDENSSEFFSDMYKIYNSFMVIGCAALVLFVKVIASFMFRKDFYDAWRLVPPLLISVIFGALTGFIGSICLAYKDSKSMGRATAIGASVNVVLNLVLIPFFSAMGASIATAISYFTMSALALLFVSKHVDIKVSYIKNIISYILLVIESIIMILELHYHLVISAVIFIAIVLIYYRDFYEILSVLINKVVNKKKQNI